MVLSEGGIRETLRDIAGMLRVSGDEIDKTYIAEWAQKLGLTNQWQIVLDRLHG